MRTLNAITVACWVAPEEIKHQVVVHSAPLKDSVDDASFSLRLREGWQVWFTVMAADGERRGVGTPGPGFDRISYPERRNWVFLAGTYDGETVALYVNDECMEKRKFGGAKKIRPLTAPVRIGGIDLEYYHGASDEFSLYARALSPEEIKTCYGARAGFKPRRIPPKNSGTIDGEPYAGCEQYSSWMTVPLGSNRLLVSNTGEIRPFGCSPVCAQNQWVPIEPIAIMSQSRAKEKFYRALKGSIELRSDGSTHVLLEGETAGGLAVRQNVEVTREREVKFSYSFASLKPAVPEPFIEFPLHLWPSAMRFTGRDARGPITGNLMDLDGTLLFQDVLEINLISSDNRLGFDFGKRARYHMVGTRDPRAWSNGYTTFPGRIVAAETANRWSTEGKLDVEFTFRLEPDTQPPRLDRAQALTILMKDADVIPPDYARGGDCCMQNGRRFGHFVRFDSDGNYVVSFNGTGDTEPRHRKDRTIAAYLNCIFAEPQPLPDGKGEYSFAVKTAKGVWEVGIQSLVFGEGPFYLKEFTIKPKE